jgi:hypothetical protein
MPCDYEVQYSMTPINTSFSIQKPMRYCKFNYNIYIKLKSITKYEEQGPYGGQKVCLKEEYTTQTLNLHNLSLRSKSKP